MHHSNVDLPVFLPIDYGNSLPQINDSAAINKKYRRQKYSVVVLVTISTPLILKNMSCDFCK